MEAIVAQFYGEGQFSGEVVQKARDGRRVPSLCRWVLDMSTQVDIDEFHGHQRTHENGECIAGGARQLADRAVHLRKSRGRANDPIARNDR